MKNQRKEKHHKRTDGFIDLASTMQAARSANAVYLRPECSTDLILDSPSKNQESGSLGIFCGVCNRTFDSSLVNLRKKPLIQQYLAILTLYSLDMFKRTKELSTRIMMSILSMTLNLMQINSS